MTKGLRALVLVPALAVAVGVGAMIGASGGKADVFAAQGDTAGSGAPSTITVSGSGDVKVTPDVAYVSVAVDSRAASAKEAQAANAKQFGALENVLYTKHNMDPKDVQTTGFVVQPVYTYNDKDGTNKITGYTATHSIQITMRDLAGIGQLLDELSSAGANRVDGVRFDTEKQDQYELQALDDAMNHAKAKADALAKAAGRQVKGVVSITQNGESSPPVVFNAAAKSLAAADSGGSTSVQAGQIDVTADITVVYEMQ
ncbi:SIMPL domain-containing protein [Paenibacillus humicola]|uniref:SIMPL domain-containing protein n=1 Tax=Paenibacillus humicola TaxID=3110540 RepID=UPI00237B9230|nr:SIMPL domain-containing protein [Paenibacillus humicola]